MTEGNKKVDNYIMLSADFAKPILWKITELVHKACPEVQEELKWNFPCFMYKGSILCNMAAFKQHCSFGFWLESKMKDPHKILNRGKKREGMGQLGKITSVKDLPADKILISYIKEAMQLVDKGEKLVKATPVKKDLKVPAYFIKALNSNKSALNTFENFSYSKKKEYVEWVTDAKTEATRQKRLDTAIDWMAEGKERNWKYLKC